MTKILPILIVLILVTAIGGTWKFDRRIYATSFEECVAQGHPIMESYPSQCNDGRTTFTENIGNEMEKFDLVRIFSPRPGASIKSPLHITGEARGTWFFEGSFSVIVVDWKGKTIGRGLATTTENSWTENFVPYTADITFTVDPQASNNRGVLILQKDNPSGLPEHDDALEVPVLLY